MQSVYVDHDIGKMHKSLSPWVSYLTSPNQSFLTCNTEVNNNTDRTRLMYKSLMLKSLSSLSSLCPNDRSSLKTRRQGWWHNQEKTAFPVAWFKWKWQQRFSGATLSPSEMGLGVGERCPHSVSVRERMPDRNHSWKIIVSGGRPWYLTLNRSTIQ